MPTIDQIRAARALLNWSQSDLATRADLSQTGIARIESGVNMPNSSTLDKITAAFDEAGIEFIADRGVEKRRSDIRIFRGVDGFADFRADVLNVVKQGPTEICVSNVEEKQFDKWGAGAVNRNYFDEMSKIKTFNFRILVQEGDTHFTASNYAQYRWLPIELFGEIPFYVYGDKTAIITFEDEDFNAFVVEHPKITAFYRRDFDRLWAVAQEAKDK